MATGLAGLRSLQRRARAPALATLSAVTTSMPIPGSVFAARGLKAAPGPGSSEPAPWASSYTGGISASFAAPTTVAAGNLPPPPPPKLDLLAKYISLANMGSAGQHRAHLHRVRAEFARHEGDSGSTEVQVAQLTQKIKWLNEHMQRHHKDVHSRRGLEAMVAQRRKLLKYLRGDQPAAYHALIYRLGMKDTTYVGSKYPPPKRKAA